MKGLSRLALPVRLRITLVLHAVSIGTAVLICGPVLTYDTIAFRNSAAQRLATLGAIVADNSTAALAFQNPGDAEEILGALKVERHIVSAVLYDARAHIFAKYPASLPDSAFPRPGPDGFRFSHSALLGYQPVVLNGKRIGTLRVESDLEALHSRLRIYAGVLVLVVLAAGALSLALSAFLHRAISDPILALANVAAVISERRDYSVRAAALGGAEFAVLTDSFNHMLSEIETLNRDQEERVRQRTAELEAANRELETFSYSVSHDLRAPLRHINGYAQLLAKHLESHLDDTAHRFLRTITESATRLGTLIDELLQFSRRGRAELQWARADTRALVDEIIRELHADLSGRAIDWRIGDLPSVQADPSLLRQVWTNLLHNAVKYTRRQPAARIELSHRFEPSSGHIFCVRDNGAGFDMRYANQLFGVFKRLHRAEEFEGTGIGLANVQRIVLRHGGRVWAEGEPNVGAAFYFSLPARASPPPGS